MKNNSEIIITSDIVITNNKKNRPCKSTPEERKEKERIKNKKIL